MNMIRTLLWLSVSLIQVFGTNTEAPCSTSTDCQTLYYPYCHSNVCSPCNSNADCTKFQSNGYCDLSPDPHVCVFPCLIEGDCVFRSQAKCNIATYTCSNCTANIDCDFVPGLHTCYSGICGNCAVNSDCSSEMICVNNKCSVCNPSNNQNCQPLQSRCVPQENTMNQCLTCLASAQCSSFSPYTKCNSGTCIIPTPPGPPSNPPSCSSNSQCVDQSAGFCNTTLATCLPCQINTECQQFKTYYNNPSCSGGYCYQCLSDNDCSDRYWAQCLGYLCQYCTADSHCGHLGYSRCVNGVCQPCEYDSDCGTGQICNQEYKCQSGCKDSSECTSIALPRCLPSTYSCVECLKDFDCTWTGSTKWKCNIPTRNCEYCVDDYDCASPTASRCGNWQCTGCKSDSDCSQIQGLSRCDASIGTCRTCNQATSGLDCRARDAPRCKNSTGTCVPCQSDTDCDNQGVYYYCVLAICQNLRVNISITPTTVPLVLNSFYQVTAHVYTNEPEYVVYWSVGTLGVLSSTSNQYLYLTGFNQLEGQVYPTNFEVVCYTVVYSGNYYVANLSLPIDQAPSLGNLTAPSQFNIFTETTLYAYNWEDVDNHYPLNYEFGYAYGNINSLKNLSVFTYLNPMQLESNITYQFELGNPASNYEVTVVLKIMDALGAIEVVSHVYSSPLPTVPEILTAVNSESIFQIWNPLNLALSGRLQELQGTISGCPTCSGNGYCSNNECVCNGGYNTYNCSLPNSEFNQLDQVRISILRQCEAAFDSNPTNQTLIQDVVQMYGILLQYPLLTKNQTALRIYTALEQIITNLTNHTNLLNTEIINAISESFGYWIGFANGPDCTDTFTPPNIETAIVTSGTLNLIPYVGRSVDAFFKTLRHWKLDNTGPNIPEADFITSSFIYLIRRLAVVNYENLEIGYNGSTPFIFFPSYVPQFVDTNQKPVNDTAIDYAYLMYNPDLTICTWGSQGSFQISFYEINSDVLRFLAQATTFVIEYPVINTETFSCSYGCIEQEQTRKQNVKFISCYCSGSILANVNNEEGLLGSNLGDLTNLSSLLSFNIIGSPVFYLIMFLWILVAYMAYWGRHKDRESTQTLFFMQNNTFNKLQKILLYLKFCHPVLNIIYLTHNKVTRASRALIFHTKLMGMLAFSAVFKQSGETSQSTAAQLILAILPIVVLTPVTTMLRLLFIVPNPKSIKKHQWLAYKLPTAYFLTFASDVIYVYIILVISASHQNQGEALINSWVFGFFMTVFIENLAVQPIRITVQVQLYAYLLAKGSSLTRKTWFKLFNIELRKVYVVTYDRQQMFKTGQGVKQQEENNLAVDLSKPDPTAQKPPKKPPKRGLGKGSVKFVDNNTILKK